ncbi:short-chain dehydrogenase/reductase SDR [Archangium gephyra]|uniref:Short-chain dehydrogenase/reductase SDR n=1 Tax=Archangium gephyra TaxID=48 RepID=A0AAC8TF03_9BACT|nr:short-chain dehydrogenase/reductase SDR [Archangium gephyra]
MSRRLEGKAALVTGAGSGIGRAAAAVFAREGARVIVSDVNVPGGAETVAAIQKQGGEARFIRCDISKPAEVEALIRGAVEAFGRLDCAVNNAGISGVMAPTGDYPEDMWDRIMATNLKGVWLCMKQEIQQMLKQGAVASSTPPRRRGWWGCRWHRRMWPPSMVWWVSRRRRRWSTRRRTSASTRCAREWSARR